MDVGGPAARMQARGPGDRPRRPLPSRLVRTLANLALRCRRSAGTCLLACFATAPTPAQGVLDFLDGETLYEGGWLVTLGFDLARGERLRQGEWRVADPLAQHETTTQTTLGLQYGLRNKLQLGVVVPWTAHAREGRGFDAEATGLGDVDLLGKWRFYRFDAPGVALNVALLGALSLPTGEDDAEDAGARLEPELQPGSGGVDPAIGLGATHEPGRWRFNAAALYRFRTDTDQDHARLGDELVVELATGNRFWLEPYPGPFMRADLAVRYYWQDHSRQQGELRDTGGERATVAVNWAFRPRPSIDVQVNVEVPLWQDVSGTGLGEDWAVDFAVGYRF